MSDKPALAFAGLGAMGGGMATNLVKNGYTVTGYDVFQPLVDKFVAAGGKSAATPKATAASAQFFVSMVANHTQNASLLFDGPDAAIHGFAQNATFILCSTVPPAFLTELRSRLDTEFSRPDVKLLDCPVSGGTLRAADGTLSIFASGPDPDLKAANPILTTMSANLYHMGALTAGQKTKTIHQLLAATNIISASEAAGLAATAGLDTAATYKHIQESSRGASFMHGNRLPHMLASDWSALSALAIILKDTLIVTDVAREASFPAPLANAALATYLQGVQAGLLREDDAKLVQLYLPRADGEKVAALAGRPSPTAAATEAGVTQETVADLLAGIHLAASVEAMAFCASLDQDRATMCEIIGKAAGWCAMFTECVPGMLGADKWSLSECNEAREVGERLGAAVEKCQRLRVPCPMGAAALQQFYFAGLGK